MPGRHAFLIAKRRSRAASLNVGHCSINLPRAVCPSVIPPLWNASPVVRDQYAFSRFGAVLREQRNGAEYTPANREKDRGGGKPWNCRSGIARCRVFCEKLFRPLSGAAPNDFDRVEACDKGCRLGLEACYARSGTIDQLPVLYRERSFLS